MQHVTTESINSFFTSIVMIFLVAINPPQNMNNSASKVVSAAALKLKEGIKMKFKTILISADTTVS